MAKILLILTGGTICCQKRDGILSSNTQQAELALVDNFRSGGSPWLDTEFVSRFPIDTLSENMALKYWQLLLEELKRTDFSAWDGIILLHGTDSLGFSAAMLDAALAGLSVPLVMISSNYPLADKRANGNDNFRAAVDLLRRNILPGGVWSVYRNADGIMRLHRGRELRQCPVGSDDFSSMGALDIAKLEQPLPAEASANAEMPLYRMKPLRNCVLKIEPHVGLDYSRFYLNGIRAVVHGVYHCGTACTGRRSPDQAYDSTSLLSLLDSCKEWDIPFFIGPVDYGPRHDPYSTMADYLNSGAIPVIGVSPETVYARAVVGCALYEDNASLIDFVQGK